MRRLRLTPGLHTSASRVPCQAVSPSGQKVPPRVPNLSLPNFLDSVLLGLEATSRNWPDELHATPDSPSSPPGPQAAPGHLFWSLPPLGAPACLPAHPTSAPWNPPRASPAGARPQPHSQVRGVVTLGSFRLPTQVVSIPGGVGAGTPSPQGWRPLQQCATLSQCVLPQSEREHTGGCAGHLVAAPEVC